MTDHLEYEEARWTEHSTIGDATKRIRRDSDAFCAGAQHALDRLICAVDDLVEIIDPRLADYIYSRAAAILDSVHHGRIE